MNPVATRGNGIVKTPAESRFGLTWHETHIFPLPQQLAQTMFQHTRIVEIRQRFQLRTQRFLVSEMLESFLVIGAILFHPAIMQFLAYFTETRP